MGNDDGYYERQQIRDDMDARERDLQIAILDNKRELLDRINEMVDLVQALERRIAALEAYRN